jgi:NAD(P)-dependent dehydrogenase (short-subunit alcohol dehydrogenase family)
VVQACTDRGYRIARDLLRAGCRVAVTGRCATDLARVLHQLNRVISRVETRFGAINAIIDAETGSEHGEHDGVPLEAA